jgi:hypothetical protein
VGRLERCGLVSSSRRCARRYKQWNNTASSNDVVIHGGNNEHTKYDIPGDNNNIHDDIHFAGVDNVDYAEADNIHYADADDICPICRKVRS